MLRSALTSLTIAALLASPASAGCYEDAMLVLDASGSMAAADIPITGPTRLDHAKSALAKVLPDLPEARRMGLMTYGAGQETSCDTVRLRVAPMPQSQGSILAEIGRLSPSGGTPLADAVRSAAEVLEHRVNPVTLVVLTDGEDTCGGAVCHLAETLRAEGRDTIVHVIGFRILESRHGVPQASISPGCLAAETGGYDLRVDTAEELTEALSRTLSCPLIASLE
ncbi:vWA domain-containing protein [Litorisediminicola beolgyonensis]|uniref:VWA domain-containing protein n=1 Tax=Litorisediminicola beolgyonensis TaxID=1173614 RepID=A0ABW3ZD94_9RHOB